MIVQTVALAIGIWLTVLLARLVAAWIRRQPEAPPDEAEQIIMLGIERLRNRPEAEREQLLEKIRRRLAE